MPIFRKGCQVAYSLFIISSPLHRPFYNNFCWSKSSASCPTKRSYRIYHRCYATTCNHHHLVSSQVPDTGKQPFIQEIVATPEIEKFQRFVIFSDLHLRKDNVETCIQVLKYVHEVAYERNAGVVFLGDFWDKRGSLPVEPLNAVIEQLLQWKQPLIMIPGNHDQVSYDGSVHSLLPIVVSLKQSPFTLLIDQPSIFLRALWIPFIRETSLFTQVVSSIKSLSPWKDDYLQAVFCHTDIQGAQLVQNESSPFNSYLEGVAPECFPSNVLVYSGHFHKPQQLPNTNIRYVGSPFQVSAMESGQQKCLLLVDRSQGWSVVETIPIAFGPQHYYFDASHLLESSDSLQLILDRLQPRDKVFLQMHCDTPESQSTPLLKALREKASVFTYRIQPPKKEQVISSSLVTEEMRDPIRIFQRYAEEYRLDADTVGVGIDVILQAIAGGDGGARDDFSCTSIDLRLDWVELDGFGCFRDPVTYPLSHRGLVLLTGENRDDRTSTSNGSGKTTLLMAALWCLVASSNSSMDFYGGAHVVIHDQRKQARVTIYGQCRGKSLRVTRCVQKNNKQATTTATQRLRFWVNDEEWTCQELRATQCKLDEWIDARLLSYCVFFGQHTSIYDLFASHDKGWKEHLGRFTPLDIWEECRQILKKYNMKTCEEEMLVLRSKIENTQHWKKHLELRMEEMQQQQQQRWLQQPSPQQEEAEMTQQKVDESIQRLRNQIQDIQHRHIYPIQQYLQRVQTEMAQVQRQMTECQVELKWLVNNIQRQWEECQVQYERWQQQRKEKRKRLERFLSNIAKNDPSVTITTSSLPQVLEKHLQLLQSQWEKWQEEWRLKSYEVTPARWEKEYYSRWKRWQQRYQYIEMQQNKVCNQKMSIQLQLDKACKENWICDSCLQPVDPKYHKRALEKMRQTLQENLKKEAKIKEICKKVRERMEMAKERYWQRVYDSIAEWKREMSDIQMEKERILRERTEVQQKILQWQQLEQEYHQLESEPSWKNLATSILNRLTEKDKETIDRMNHEKDGEELTTSLIAEILQQRKNSCQQQWNDRMNEFQRLQKEYEEQSRMLEQYNQQVTEWCNEKRKWEARREYLERESVLQANDPWMSLLQKEKEELERCNQQLNKWNEEWNKLEADRKVFQQLEKIFGPRGIPHFVLKTMLFELQQTINYYLSMICDGYIQVELKPFTMLKSKKEQWVETIDKKIFVHNAQGSWTSRIYSQLSGGQRRRVGVALALAFHDIGIRRCGFRCNLLVLDEIFQHLDSEGKRRVAKVLEQLGKESVFVVVHELDEATNHLARAFHDVVTRQEDVSHVTVDRKSG